MTPTIVGGRTLYGNRSKKRFKFVTLCNPQSKGAGLLAQEQPKDIHNTPARDSSCLAQEDGLRETRHFVTSSHADGPKGKVMLIHPTIPRHDVPEIIQIIKKHDPRAVYTIEDVRSADEPIPLKIPNMLHRVFYRRNGK